MIEVILELKLDSFLVNSVGGSGDSLVYVPSKALRYFCGKVSSARTLTDNTPSTGFDFLSTSGLPEVKTRADGEFDDKLVSNLSAPNAVDTSNVLIAAEPSDNRKKPEGATINEIGRMFLSQSPDKVNTNLKLNLFLKQSEFEEIWQMTLQQKLQHVMATLVCYKLKQSKLIAEGESMLSVGILSSSLRMMPSL